MAKIDRYDGNLEAFASDSTSTNRTVFGAETQSDTLDDNINTEFKEGWEIVGANESPTKQDFNAVAYTTTQLLAYLHQMGTPEWNITQEYHTGSITIRTGILYISQTDTNIGNDPSTDLINWFDVVTQKGLYLRKDGSVPLEGAWDMGNQSLTNVNIDSGEITGIVDLAIEDGGTGASTSEDARTNLGVAIGIDVQAYNAKLDDISAVAVTDSIFIVGDGTNFVGESGLTARTSLGLGTIATQDSDNIDITGGSVTGITDITIADGGTGASTAEDARTNLGVAIGSDVQAHDDKLDDISVVAVTDSNFIVGDGTNFVGESGLTARTSLGLGTIATQDSDNIDITGGSVTGITDLLVADGGTGASTLTDGGIVLGSGTGAITVTAQPTNGQLLVGSTGNDPVLSTLTAGVGISIDNTAGGVTVSSVASGMGYNEIAGTTQQAVADTVYTCNNAGLVTVTLPDTAAVGTTLGIIGKGAGGFLIAQNASESIHVGTVTSTVGVGGSVASTEQYDVIYMVCTVADLTWTATQMIGNLTIV